MECEQSDLADEGDLEEGRFLSVALKPDDPVFLDNTGKRTEIIEPVFKIFFKSSFLHSPTMSTNSSNPAFFKEYFLMVELFSANSHSLQVCQGGIRTGSAVRVGVTNAESE